MPHRKEASGREDGRERVGARAAKVAEYAENFATPYIAARRGYVDDIIEPVETREKLIAAYRLLDGKRVTLPRKKHGNIPL